MIQIKNYTNLSKILSIYQEQNFYSNVFLKDKLKFKNNELTKYQKYQYKEYLIQKSLYTQLLVDLKLVKFIYYKYFCLYTSRNRAVFSKYRMSRHYLKFSKENFKLIY